MSYRMYETLEAFHGGEPARARSPEVDFGVWWTENPTGGWPYWRISFIADTGELYAQRLGPAKRVGPRFYPTGPVRLYAQGITREQAEEVLEGWEDMCGKAISLTWAQERARRWLESRPASSVTAT